MLTVEFYLMCTVLILVVASYSLVAKKNMIRLLLGIAILGNAANMNFIVLSTYRFEGSSYLLGTATVIILIVLEACVTAVGLTIVIYAYRHFKTLDVRELRRLRW